MTWVAVAIGGSALLGAYSSNEASNKQASGAGQASQLQTNMFNNTSQNFAPWMSTGKLALSDLGTRLGIPGSNLANDPDYTQFAQNYKNSIDASHKARYGMSLFDSRSGLNAPGQQTNFDEQIKSAYLQQHPNAGSNDANFGQLTKPFTLSDFQESPAFQFNLQQGQTAIDKAAAARHNFYSPATLQQIAKYSQGVASGEFQNAMGNYNTFQNNLYNRLYNLSGAGQNAAAQQGGFGTTVGGQLGENAMGAANAGAAGQIGIANAVAGGVGSYFNQNMLSQYLANQQAPTYGARSSNLGTAGWGDVNSNQT